ncbi:MAG: hypothetical protein P8R48_06155 [Planctomycetota bacterium]|mgnify:CR=1 FL=1|nr:hypothetical protein [Planctomycetota bacterium]
MIIIDTIKNMTDERFLAIYEALTDRGFGPLDGEVAKALKFRPQAIRKLAIDKRARKARQIVLSGNNAELAYELCGGYLMRSHEKLMPDFLDAMGIPHEDGMIEDMDETTPDAAKLDDVLAQLDKDYPSEDVTLYLCICAMQWPEIPELLSTWEKRVA